MLGMAQQPATQTGRLVKTQKLIALISIELEVMTWEGFFHFAIIDNCVNTQLKFCYFSFTIPTATA